MCGHHPKNLKAPTTKEQNSREEYVRTLADELKTDNWEVKAKSEGWEKPAKLGAFTPDIDAKTAVYGASAKC
jgi:hypothetical protein